MCVIVSNSNNWLSQRIQLLVHGSECLQVLTGGLPLPPPGSHQSLHHSHQRSPPSSPTVTNRHLSSHAELCLPIHQKAIRAGVARANAANLGKPLIAQLGGEQRPNFLGEIQTCGEFFPRAAAVVAERVPRRRAVGRYMQQYFDTQNNTKIQIQLQTHMDKTRRKYMQKYGNTFCSEQYS